MKPKKTAALFMALVMTASALLFAGCGQKEQPSGDQTPDTSAQSSDPAESTGQAASADTEKPVTLRFMWWGSDERHEATLEVINQYQTLHPNVTIEAEYGGYDGYFEKLTTQLSGGTAADIVQYDASMTKDLLAIGDVFSDLTQYADILDTSGFDQNFLNSFSIYDGKMVGLPTGVNAGIFLTNSQLFTDAGLKTEDIKTWDDFIAAGKQIHENNPEQYLFNEDIGTLGKEVLHMLMAQITGKELMDMENYTLNFTRDDLYRAFSTINEMYESNVLEPIADSAPYGYDVITNPKWISHDLACNYTSTSNVTGTYYDFTDTAVALQTPVYEDAKETGILLRPAQLIGIASNCEHPEAAADFLNYFYNSEEAAKALKTCRSIPATSMGLSVCEQEGYLNEVIVDAVEIAQAGATANQNLSVPNEVTEILQDATEKIGYKQGTVDEITDSTMTLLEEVLARLAK